MGTKRVEPSAEQAIAALAGLQHGVVSLSQMLGAGLSRGAVKRRSAGGRLHRVHRGVYAVGHSCLTDHGRWMAAVLAAGPGTVLSHRSAGALWGLCPPPTGAVHVRAVLAHHAVGSTSTRSELQERFLGLCRDASIPQPDVNASLDRYTVDFLWPSQRLIAETDGYASHGTRAAHERDRERDVRLAVLGYLVVRFTYRQVTREPRLVASRLRSLLRNRGYSPSSRE